MGSELRLWCFCGVFFCLGTSLGTVINLILKLTKDVPNSKSGLILSTCSAIIMIHSVVILARIKYYEANISGLLYHVYYLAAIESILNGILFIVNTLTLAVSTLSILFFSVMLTFIAMLRKPKEKFSMKIILLLKVILCAAQTIVYYLGTFSLTSDPELILLGLYFNCFYMMYLIIKKNETVEENNDPEDPTAPRVVSSNPASSETDRGDSLPSYEESFNYPNSQFKNNIDK